MYKETFHDDNDERITESFMRFDGDDVENLMGKRINGKGKITSYTQAKGELHPAFVTTDEGHLIAAHELRFQDFDGRHTDIQV